MQHITHPKGSCVLALLALTVVGCASGVDSAVFMPAAPLPDSESVRIYSTQQPACAYDEVGLVRWRPASSFDTMEKGVERMRRRAREMGGHAIVGFTLASRETGTTTTVKSDSTSLTMGSSVNRQTEASGTVVRFRTGACDEVAPARVRR